MTRYDDWQTQTSGHFATGVQWLQAEGPHLVTRAILTALLTAAAPGGYVSEYLRGKLTDALRKLPAQPLVPNVASIWGTPQNLETLWNQWQQSTASAEPDPEQPYNNTRLPRTGPLREHLLALHRRHSAAHALMAATETPQARRAELAREIMLDIIPALDAGYDRVRAGATDLPTPAAVAAATPIKRLLSLRSRVSTIRSQLKKPGLPAKRRAQLDTELAAKLAEIASLENEI